MQTIHWFGLKAGYSRQEAPFCYGSQSSHLNLMMPYVHEGIVGEEKEKQSRSETKAGFMFIQWNVLHKATFQDVIPGDSPWLPGLVQKGSNCLLWNPCHILLSHPRLDNHTSMASNLQPASTPIIVFAPCALATVWLSTLMDPHPSTRTVWWARSFAVFAIANPDTKI